MGRCPTHAPDHPTDEDLSVGTPGARMDRAQDAGLETRGTADLEIGATWADIGILVALWLVHQALREAMSMEKRYFTSDFD